MTAQKLNHCLILLGMPGAGKSSLGRALAARLECSFVDTDELIEQRMGEALQTSLERLGYRAMREREGRIVARAPFDPGAVVATGGSVVYSRRAMRHLSAAGLLVYLALPLAELAKRVDNWSSRGFSRAPGQSLSHVFAEREPLYRRWADVILDCTDQPFETLLDELETLYRHIDL